MQLGDLPINPMEDVLGKRRMPRRIAVALALMAPLACSPPRAVVVVRQLGDRFAELNGVFATVTDGESARYAKPTLIRIATRMRTIDGLGPLDPDTARWIVHDPTLGPRLERESQTFIGHLVRLNCDEEIRTELGDVLGELGRLRSVASPPR